MMLGLVSTLRDAATAAQAWLKRWQPLTGLDHTLTLRVPLRGGSAGSMEDWYALEHLQELLGDILFDERIGQVAGSAFHEGEGVIVMHVRDADVAFDAVKAALSVESAVVGGYAVQWHGDVDDPNVTPLQVFW